MTDLSSIGILWAEPSDGKDLNVVTVSPGLPGFIAMFLLAVAVVLLAVDMTRRIRRLQAQERVAERHRLADEEAARQEEAPEGAEAQGAPDGEAPDASEDPGTADGHGTADGPGTDRP